MGSTMEKIKVTDYRLLKRLEDLLRLGLSTKSINESRSAFEEALKTVVKARALPDLEQWKRATVMRYEKCALCGEDISPGRRVYRCENSFTHEKCWNEREDTKENGQ